MLKERRRIENAFEIALDFVFGSNWRDCAAWCTGCESYVPMVTTLSAATLEKTSITEIYQRAENGELHFKITVKGALLICFSSLFDTSRAPHEGNLFSNFSENL